MEATASSELQLSGRGRALLEAIGTDERALAFNRQGLIGPGQRRRLWFEYFAVPAAALGLWALTGVVLLSGTRSAVDGQVRRGVGLSDALKMLFGGSVCTCLAV
ncbi:hypothetical protein BH09MYX1_BH09MYX1_67680 [soil metagenome]